MLRSLTDKYLSKLNQLFVKTSGIDEGEPLIVLHGWGMNSAVWDLIKPTLESQFRVSWIDLPGHGENATVDAKSLAEIVELLLPVIPKNAHLMGWSLGGLIIQAIANKVPGAIQSMTLVASTPRFSQSDNWQHAMSEEVLNGFASSLQKDLKATLKRFIALQFMGVTGSKDIQRALTISIMKKIPEPCINSSIVFKQQKRAIIHKWGGVLSSLSLGLEILQYEDFRVKSHKVPQHWILAGRDRLIPKEVINDLKLIRPDDQISLLENAGHAPFMTHPDAFLDLVLPFIKRYSL